MKMPDGDVSRVPVDAVLQSLQKLLANHAKRTRTSADGTGEVVAIALDERPRFTGLLSEALRVADGLLVDAASYGARLHIEHPGADTLSALTAAVENILAKYNILDPEANLTLSISDDKVSIEGSVPYEAANTAQRSIRDLLMAVFDPNLRGALLAALIWPDDGLDDRHQVMVWPLLMELPKLLIRPGNSTLIVFLGDANLDFNLHCTGNPSVMGHISSNGYEERRTFEANSLSVRYVSRLTRDEAPLVVLFLGAGASAVEGLPTGNELRNRALGRQVDFAVDRSNYDEAARKFYHQLQALGDRLRPGEESAGEDVFVASLTLERVLLEEQAQEHRVDCRTIRDFATDHADMAAALNEAREAGKFNEDPLVKLLQLRRRLVLITVNFDRIIEIKAGDNVKPYISEADLSQLPADLTAYARDGGPVPLIKLHGDIDNPSSIVANIQEAAGGLSVARLEGLNAIIALIRKQQICPWWFVGYSMRDLDLQAIWQSPDFTDKMVEHWVAPFRDPAVCTFINSFRQPRWDTETFGYSIENRIVTLTAVDFFRILLNQISGTW